MSRRGALPDHLVRTGSPDRPRDAAGTLPHDLELLHHVREQEALASLTSGLGQGRPAVATVTGPPGFGQNALVRRAGDRAAEHGARVLSARATPAERDLPHAVVAQLLAAVPGIGDRSPRTMAERAGSGRVWGMSELLRAARGRPAVLVVQDAQWADQASSDWLRTLIRRLPGSRVALLVAGVGGCTSHPEWLRMSSLAPGTVAAADLVLRPLSEPEVGAAVEAVCGRPGEKPFTAAVTRIAAGNPSVLHGVLRRFTGRGYAPVGNRVPELRAIGEAVNADHACRALRSMDPGSLAALRALAVCGDVLDSFLLCALTGVPAPGEPELRAKLEATGVVRFHGRRPHVEPAVRDRLLEDMPDDERADLFARAAELAHRAALSDEDIAGLLLNARQIGQRWAVEVLRRCFDVALMRQDRERAVACLSRALREPLEPRERIRLSLRLATAELASVPDAGERRLSDIVRTPGDDLADLRVRALDLLATRESVHEVRRTVTDVLPHTHGAERDNMIALLWGTSVGRPEDFEPAVPEIPAMPDRPECPAQAGIQAMRLTLRGEDIDGARALARSALARCDGDFFSLVLTRLAACRTLLLADEFDEAEARLDGLLFEARRDDIRIGVQRTLALRTELNLRRGRLAAAERDVSGAERAAPLHTWHELGVPYVMALRILVDLAIGEHDRARLHAAAPTPPGARDSLFWSYLLVARGTLALRDGRAGEARELLLEGGRRLLHRQWVNPAVVPWRSAAALACHQLGDTEQARRLHDDALALARRWGAPSVVGTAQAFAAASAAEGRLGMAREAVRTLRDSPARFPYAQALLELAEAELLEPEGSPPEAARLVAEVTKLTATYPAGSLARHARRLAAQLEARGEGPLGAWRALSPAERHTAVLAGRGLANGVIAQTLSVSRRTVELRLSSTYRKLGISGRRELRGLVRTMEGR